MMIKFHSLLGCSRRVDISFSFGGKIDISARVVRALGISKGDVIDILTGDGEFYLYVSSRATDACGRHLARCYPTQTNTRHFRANCRRLCAAILKATGLNGRARFPAGEVTLVNGHKAIPIITKKIIHE